MFAGFAGVVAMGVVAGAVLVDSGHAHSVTIDHHRGAVDAQYRSRVAVTHRQMGAVAPGGVPSTLRCAWSADLDVERVARHANGLRLARSFRHADVASGSRPGWCAAAKPGIARDVAARDAVLRSALQRAADADRTMIVVELDRSHAAGGRG